MYLSFQLQMNSRKRSIQNISFELNFRVNFTILDFGIETKLNLLNYATTKV